MSHKRQITVQIVFISLVLNDTQIAFRDPHLNCFIKLKLGDFERHFNPYTMPITTKVSCVNSLDPDETRRRTIYAV